MRVFVLAVLVGFLSVPSSAQTLWSRPYEPNQLSFEAIVPDPGTNATALSGATFITGTFSLSENVELTSELPIARYNPTDGVTGPTTTTIGNPYVGLGLSSTNVPVLLQIGGRIPAAQSNSAVAIGEAADIGRTPAFRPEEVTLSGLLNGRYELSRHTTFRLRSGVEFGTRPSSEPDGGRIQSWRLHYNGQFWREGDRFISGLTYTGRTSLSSSQPTQHHVSVSVMGNWSLIQPGIIAGASAGDLFRDGELKPFVGLTLCLSYGRL